MRLTLACRHKAWVPASVMHVVLAYGHAWCERCERMKDIMFDPPGKART